MGKTAYLVLENGKTFQGQRFGADGQVTAEVVVHHRHDWLFGDADRSAAIGADRGPHIPSYRQLRRDPRRL